MRFQEGELRDQFQTEASASPIWKSTDKYHFGLGPLQLFSSSFQNPEIFMKAPNGFNKDFCSAANFGFRGGRWRSIKKCVSGYEKEINRNVEFCIPHHLVQNLVKTCAFTLVLLLLERKTQRQGSVRAFRRMQLLIRETCGSI